MGILDYISISVFTLGILLAGMSFSKSGSNMKSFFAAGGAVPWWINGLSLFMGFFSAGTFVVWGSIAYTYGTVAITIQSAMCLAGFGVGLFIALPWFKTGVLTVAEYINRRLGADVQKMYTYLFLLISMFTTGSFLYPVAKIVEVSTGFPLQGCIMLLGSICILYVAVGGLWAVVVTDVLQFVILTAAVLIVVPISLDMAGGVGGFVERAPEGFFSLFNGEYTWVFIVAFAFYNLFFLGGNWSYVQRYTTVKSKRDAKKVGLLFGALYMICPVLWMLPPMVYRILNPELSGLADEGAYLLMCKQALPSGLLGLMLGGMIFATASSLNGTLNISAGVFTNDIYKRLFPEVSEKSLMRVARISTVGFGVLAIIVALLIPYMGGIVNVVISVAALTGVPLYLPIIWTLFSKYQTKGSIMTATLLSLGLNAFFKFVVPYAFHFSFDRAQEMATGVLFPVIILAAWEVIARARRADDPQYAQYKALALAKQDPGAAEEADHSQSLRVIGIGVGAAGVFIFLLGLLSPSHKLIVMGIASILILIGSYAFSKSLKNKSIKNCVNEA